MRSIRSPEAVRELLREHGLRATFARVAVLQCLWDAQGPRSHPEVHEAVAWAGVDRATVYRNLLDLTEVGLLRRSDLGDHVWRFEPVDATHADGQGQHPHFLCTHCGTVTCLPGGAIRLRPSRGAPRALRRKDLEIQLRGLCDACC
ncbi:MAG: Fur family transcriptional regulator [Myxococcales bacterium]|nr:Fur family transcriptional regulator [Myxococcales bacterium]MDD9971055.1 Fur family transcriptional regulator [Myxococcales bacterium]